MNKQVHITMDYHEFRGSTLSHLHDTEYVVSELIGKAFPRIDDVAIRAASRIYDDREVSYKNKSEFIMHSF